MCLYILKQIMESGVAKAAIKLRNTFIAAETIIGRGLTLVFILFFGVTRDFNYKIIPVNCFEILVSTPSYRQKRKVVELEKSY